jgi:Na+/H+-translocating membrane pyrophosphatase
MMLPGAIAIVSPLLIGFIFGPEALGGIFSRRYSEWCINGNVSK